MTNQQYFKELTDIDLREKMFLEHQNQLEQDMAPFGFFSDGLEDENIGEMVDEYGTRWSPIVRQLRYKLVNVYIISTMSFSILR